MQLCGAPGGARVQIRTPTGCTVDWSFGEGELPETKKTADPAPIRTTVWGLGTQENMSGGGTGGTQQVIQIGFYHGGATRK